MTTSTSLNSRLWRWVLTILNFLFEVHYQPGKDHSLPDALSRQGWDELPALQYKDAVSSSPSNRISFIADTNL